jgi:hypothetical protein
MKSNNKNNMAMCSVRARGDTFLTFGFLKRLQKRTLHASPLDYLLSPSPHYDDVSVSTSETSVSLYQTAQPNTIFTLVAAQPEIRPKIFVLYIKGNSSAILYRVASLKLTEVSEVLTASCHHRSDCEGSWSSVPWLR